MSCVKLLAGSALLLTLAACGDTDLERGATGAAAGAVTAEVFGGNVVTGAVLGGAAGVISDDVRRELR
ncbi:hypothetical protein [Algicella marina]|uniref:Glycine zipper 2TM domain-containing protein n=1 Tax=Algicella marina TaxID=2683284 RepID=A0A6P1SYC6_9RHOB|nr:hypothetical protein [Algicella marina]QHQ33999.1 hypothetical protein GO499_01770 [Algicella marina]